MNHPQRANRSQIVRRQNRRWPNPPAPAVQPSRLSAMNPIVPHSQKSRIDLQSRPLHRIRKGRSDDLRSSVLPSRRYTRSSDASGDAGAPPPVASRSRNESIHRSTPANQPPVHRHQWHAVMYQRLNRFRLDLRGKQRHPIHLTNHHPADRLMHPLRMEPIVAISMSRFCPPQSARSSE